MRGEDLQGGKFVERTVEDQMLQGDRRGEGVADGVAQPAVAFPALIQLRHALRVDEQHGTEFFGLLSDWIEFRVGEFITGDLIADRGALQALFLHRGFKPLCRQRRVLHGQRRERRERRETIPIRSN